MKEDAISCGCDDDIDLKSPNQDVFKLKDFKNPIISVLSLIAAYLCEHYLPKEYALWFMFPLLLVSYLLVGYSVLKKAFLLLLKGDFFNEFTLMSIATLGAFYIGEYTEGVFVMLFYSTGEIIQENAVKSVRLSIKSLLELQVRTVTRIKDGVKTKLKPEELKVNDQVLVLPGEMIPLDGIVQSDEVQVNTANITGEAMTRVFSKGDILLAGMICVERPFTYEVSADWDHSYITKIMQLVEDAANKKAKTQRLISRLAKVYTPIVFFLAAALVTIPYFIDADYSFDKWLYRGLVFLVISCPCAFLIAIPLSYFGGIGLAAKKGILFKGGEVIEKMASLKAIVFDKTGTLTTGKFDVNTIDINKNKELYLSYLFEVESHSTHPLASSIKKAFATYSSDVKPDNIKEYPGKGIQAEIGGDLFLAGTQTWLIEKGITIESPPDLLPTVHIAFSNSYIGKVTFRDQLKPTSKLAIEHLRKQAIVFLAMLSGDRKESADDIGNELQLDLVKAELLPEEKVSSFIAIRDNYPGAAFVGDGVNDAPVLAAADIGIAMGAYGSEAAIQSADMVIEDDNIDKVSTAILISRKTQLNVWQNLFFAVVVKIVVLTLGAMGMAGLWEAIFADVGVALLVVLNAYRLKNYKV